LKNTPILSDQLAIQSDTKISPSFHYTEASLINKT